MIASHDNIEYTIPARISRPPDSRTPGLPDSRILLLMLALWPLFAPSAVAQDDVISRQVRPQKAFALSLVLPGWGHRYAQGGSWRGMATIYTAADAGLWIGLINAIWQHDRLTRSFRTLATLRAGADVEGKDRTFYLNLATYHSSDEYLEFQLRNRAWDRIDYVSDPSFRWAWESEDDFLAFRDMREDAETFRRRRSLFIAALVANRLLAGLASIGASNRANASLSMSVSAYGSRPMVHLGVAF